jgi:hypothetical protein
MNDDQFEQRLRRALHQHAERQVDADTPLPPMRRPQGRWATRPPFLLPLLAAAVVVIATGGTVLATRSAGHTQHAAQTAHPSSTVAPESLSLGGTGTATQLPPSSAPARPTTTAPSSTPVATSRTTAPRPPSGPPSSAPSSRPVSNPRHTAYVPPPPASSSARPSGPDVPCRGGQLALAVGGDRQVSGNARYNDYDFVYVTNTAGTCKLDGYPTVLAADRTGAIAGGPATHLTSPAPTTLVLQHGDRAEIDLYDRYGSSASCQGDVQGQLIVTPPGGGTTATLTGWQYSACNLAVTAFQPARPPEQHT